MIKHEFVSAVLAILFCAGAMADSARRDPAPFDTIIEHGHIVDGTGAPWIAADLGIRGGRVAAIGKLEHALAKTRIDARGMVIAPGFIDMLGQSEISMLVNPHVPSKIFQGITTEITGEGSSAAPLDDALLKDAKVAFDHYKIKGDWHSFAEYFARLEKRGMGINLASYVGATTVREIVVGEADRAATPQELERMRGLVAAAMREGAVGVSTALQYPPAQYANTEELIALATEAGRYGGIYATHMRSEGNAVLDALDEAIRIGREAHVPVEIWHIKAAGKANWGRMPEIVGKVEAARAAGVDVSANTYAYTAWFNVLSAFVPPWAHEGGDARLIERLKDPALRTRIRRDMETPSSDWDNEWLEIPGPQSIILSVVQSAALIPIQGKTLAEVAAVRGREPIEVLFDILIEDEAFTSVAVFGMDEADVEFALLRPWVSICNDSQGTAPDGLLGSEHPHPRAYGTFPRILRKYVREEHKLRLEEAIRKFSSLPAGRLRLADRGVLKRGMWADVVVFDPDKITDVATYETPNQLSVGMQWVFVNGVPVVAAGKQTNALPGRVLRGPAYRLPTVTDQMVSPLKEKAKQRNPLPKASSLNRRQTEKATGPVGVS